MNNAANKNGTDTPRTALEPTYRSLLQGITCERYADTAAAYAAIDEALEADCITTREARLLEAAVKYHP